MQRLCSKPLSDHVLIVRRSLQNSDISGEHIHAGNEIRRDRGGIKRKIPLDERRNQLCLIWRKHLAANFFCKDDIFDQSLVRRSIASTTLRASSDRSAKKASVTAIEAIV